jgi:hypothetical protein
MPSRALLLCFLLPVLTAAADDPWRYLDADSKLVMGVQWRRIAESPAGVQFRQQLSEAAPLPRLGGMSFLNGVDRVLVASTGPAESRAAAPPVLIVVSGQFDLAKIRASVSRKSRRAVVQGVEIFASPERGSGEPGIALVSSETLLLGDLPTLVRTLGAPGSRASTLLVRARELDQVNEFWLVSSVPPASVTDGNLPVPVPLPLDQIRSIEMGLAVQSGFSLDLAMDLGTPDAARQIKAGIEKTLRLAAKEKSRPDMAGLDRHMKVAADGGQVRVRIEIDAVELDRRMRAYQATRRRPGPAVAVSAAPEPVRPVISKPKIWNLDSPDAP